MAPFLLKADKVKYTTVLLLRQKMSENFHCFSAGSEELEVQRGEFSLFESSSNDRRCAHTSLHLCGSQLRAQQQQKTGLHFWRQEGLVLAYGLHFRRGEGRLPLLGPL